MMAFFNQKKDPLLDRDKLKTEELNEDRTPTIKFYFKLIKRHFSQLLSINLMMLFMVVPIILIVYFYLSIPKTGIQSDPAFSTMLGTSLFTSSPNVQLGLLMSGAQLNIPIYHATKYYIFIAICALFLIATWGFQNTGAIYCIRAIVRGDPVFVFSDYFYGIKKNWKQSLITGIVDFLFLSILIFDGYYFWSNASSFLNDLMLFITAAMLVLYWIMRFYIYPMLITFNIKTFKMLKNAVIFTILGIKRNLMAILWVVIVLAVNILLVILLWQINVIIPAVLPLFYLMVLIAFTNTYAAYPVIKKYMIDPQMKKKQQENEQIQAES